MAFLLISNALCSLPVQADASSSIYVRPGPTGEIHISTPWGNYVAYDKGKGTYWVGTQSEFDRRRLAGITLEGGERLSTVNAQDADETFVPSSSFRTRIGTDVPIDNIETTIMFRVNRNKPPRPLIPASSRYVAISWIQSPRDQTPLVILFNRKRGMAIRPYFTGSDGQGQFSTEYSAPRTDLVKPFALIFVLPNRMPGVVYVGSLTEASYLQDQESVRDVQSQGLAPDEETLQDITDLQRVDPSLRTTRTPIENIPAGRSSEKVVDATAASTAAPTEAAAPRSTQIYEYDGPISDTRYGDGRMTVNFKTSTWTMTFPDARANEGGTVTGVQRLDTRLNFGLTVQGCGAYAVAASILDDGSINGRYAGYEGFEQCRNRGTFNLSAIAEPQPVPSSAPSAIGAAALRSGDSPLSVIFVHAPGADLRLEVAETKLERERGLMDRQSISPHTGMIFVFNDDGPVAFWMKDTFVSLDMVFVAANGAVRRVFSNVSAAASGTPDGDIPREAGRAKYVIELPAGEASRDGIVPGTSFDLNDVPPPK